MAPPGGILAKYEHWADPSPDSLVPEVGTSSEQKLEQTLFHIVFFIFFGSSSNGCVVESHYIFNLHFPDDERGGTSSHVLIAHLYISFSEVSIQIFSHGFFFFPPLSFLLIEL